MKKTSRRPADSEYPPGVQAYFDSVIGDDAIQVLNEQLNEMGDLSSYLSADRMDRLDPPYGWTIRQVLEHCLIAERVFGYRIIRIAAGDTTPLPGFDEKFYGNARSGLGGGVASMMMELSHLRKSLLLMLARLEPSAWDRVGHVDGNSITMRAVVWVAAGHLGHHFTIIRKRLS